MTQIGRTWRAARPRRNLTEAGYSSRTPYRWQLFGELGTTPIDLAPIQLPNRLNFQAFDSLNIEWRWAGVANWKTFTLTTTAEFQEGFAQGGHRFRLTVQFGINSFWLEWREGFGMFQVTPTFLWPVSTPTSQGSAGFAFTRGVLNVLPVLYADEP